MWYGTMRGVVQQLLLMFIPPDSKEATGAQQHDITDLIKSGSHQTNLKNTVQKNTTTSISQFYMTQTLPV